MGKLCLGVWAFVKKAASAVWAFTKEVAPKVAEAAGPVLLEALIRKIGSGQSRPAAVA